MNVCDPKVINLQSAYPLAWDTHHLYVAFLNLGITNASQEKACTNKIMSR